MRNKPNFQKSQMFITVVSTRNYNEKLMMDTWSKQTQTKPISKGILAMRVILGVKIYADFGQRTSALSLATVLNVINRGLDKSRQRRKKSGRRELIRRASLLCVTAFTVNGFAFLRLKRDFTFLSTFCTSCFKHLTWSKIPPWATFAKISHDISPNRDSKKVFRTLIRGNKYNQATFRYQGIFLK
jgi:hypothetical protein